MHTQEARFNVFEKNNKFFAVDRLLFLSSSILSLKFSFFLGPMHTQEARNNVFQTIFLPAGKIRKKDFSLSANYIFFQLKNQFKVFLFLGPMHTQEARNNVFQTNFLLAENSEIMFFKFFKLEKKQIFRCRQIIIFFQLFSYFQELCTPRKPEIMFFKLIFCFLETLKKYIFCCRPILIFSQLKNQFKFLQFLGHMRTQEARNSIFKIISSFRSRKSIIFFSSKISSNFYYFSGLFTPRKPEIMFFKIIFCLREIRVFFHSRKSIISSCSKISSNFSYFQGLCTPRKPEIMFCN